TAEEGWRILRSHSVDLAVIDVMLPGASGVDLTAEIRKHSNLPIILLTALGEEEDRISGLEAGADDYVTKPFRLAELLARVRALLRRTEQG
ncbi:response regulator, partial [Streptococcus anginosus]|nr:response regulator [Streptococcus anginosus]